MKALIKYAIVGSAAVLVFGCGGSGTNNQPNPYAGSWTGTWASTEAADGGTLTLTIQSNGAMSGTMGRSGGLSGALAGIVQNTGQFSGATSFPSSGNFTFKGAMVNEATGTLNSNFSYVWLGDTYTATFTATLPVTTTAGATG